MPVTKIVKGVDRIQKKVQKQDNTWAIALKESRNPTQRGYAAESLFPY